MEARLDQVKRDLTNGSRTASGSTPPPWLPRLLETVSGLPADAVPHNRPKHADLQGAIAEAAFHPAIEACLHLINGDLYSAHFLVRKAQGGSRYLDWLHAILHKLEGDFRNAKMWYTDLGNNNAGTSKDGEAREVNGKEATADAFPRFHEFWFVPATNGGSGERKDAKDLHLESLDDLPQRLGLTAHGHTDLVFLTVLAEKAASLAAMGADSVKRNIEKHHSSTTASEDKIKNSQAAFSLDELQSLYEQLSSKPKSQSIVRGLTQLELLWMLGAMVGDFGWRQYSMADSLAALKVESTPANESLDDDRKSKASNMVFNPSQGQRTF